MPNPNGGLFSAFHAHILPQFCTACQSDFMPNPKDRFPTTYWEYGHSSEKGEYNMRFSKFNICKLIIGLGLAMFVNTAIASNECYYFRLLWQYYLEGGVSVSSACSGSQGWAATACGGTTTECYAWYKSVDYTNYNYNINGLICSLPGLDTERAAAELGLDCSVVGPTSGQIYVMANCSKITSSSSEFYSLCKLDSDYSCDRDMSIKCEDILGYNGYVGGLIDYNGTSYLVCFNSADGNACNELKYGCSPDYSVRSSYDLTISGNPSTLTTSTVYQTTNIGQLKCCYGFSSEDNTTMDNGRGVTCSYTKQCDTDGSKSVLEAFCRCSEGYYSNAPYTYYIGDENDAYETMVSVCDSCENTVPTTGANYVDRPPTSNGNVGITGCYLPIDTQGIDDTGAYTISGRVCFYSK